MEEKSVDIVVQVPDTYSGVPQLLSWESARKRSLSWANVLAPGDGSCH